MVEAFGHYHLPPNSMKLLNLFTKNKQPKYFHQFYQGSVRGLLGWIQENGKNVLVVELESCDEKWNWKHAGHFRFMHITDVRAVFDCFTEVIKKHARGE
jgi:hypothetical protein